MSEIEKIQELQKHPNRHRKIHDSRQNYETDIIQLLKLDRNPIPENFQKTNYNKIRPLKFTLSNWGRQIIIILSSAITGIIITMGKIKAKKSVVFSHCYN